MCGIEAGKRGRRVALLEHQDRLGKKIAISGGGRCNFTNIHASAANYLSGQSDFCKSALARYRPADFIALVEQHGIPYHEKKLGQQFCDTSSQAIIDMLIAECAAARAAIRLNCVVGAVRKRDRFTLETNQGEMECDALVIATGGLSFPKLGATDFGYRLAAQFGVGVTQLRPALVPLTLDRIDLADFHSLSGLSLPVAVHHNGCEFREAMLFTHRGLSGPAILQISSYWREGNALHFNLLPGRAGDEWLATARRTKSDMASALAAVVPRRFADVWCRRHAPAKTLPHYKASELNDVARLLAEWPLTPAGTEGYAKAEVTLGGVDTSELSSRTMESRNVPGLFFIGEIVDVTGWLGGYNFQWAWASGHAAGQFV
jgi:predicted Rossmann fold flavoprotein